MAWSGTQTQCRVCGEIYSDDTTRCPFCDAPCTPLGSRTEQTQADLPVAQPQGRVERWSQKLLDLSRANRLLNLRDSKRVIPLYCPDLGKLEDAVAANKPIEIDSLANLLGEEASATAIRQPALSQTLTIRLARELAQKRLWTPLQPTEVNRRLRELYRLARQDLEESGVNTLFLGLGFVEWCPADEEAERCRAPILLVPIRFVRKSISEPIRLLRLDAETVLNATLIELLRTQFGILVPGVDPLPTDDSGVNVPLILERFRQAIAVHPGWRVVEEVVAGQFSFGKFVMWKDLTARMDDLGQHPLVRHFIAGEGIFDDGVDLPPADAPISPTSFLCPLSADSTQLAAVNYAAKGKTFVLHGPPGTGKSQTIANIIAHAIAQGRKVLFVSEKKAALDVVYSRLKSIGLGPFCLELHSNKSGKQHVLSQFAEALEMSKQPSPRQWKATLAQLDALQEKLDGDLAHLHRTYPNGQSAYDCLLRLIDRGPSPYATVLKCLCTQQTVEALATMTQAAEALAQAAEEADLAAYPALEPVRVDTWTPTLNTTLARQVEQLRSLLTEAAAAVSHFAARALPGVRFESLPLAHCAKLAQLAEAAQTPPPKVLLPLLGEDLDEAARTLRAYALAERNFDQAAAALPEYDPAAVESCDLERLQTAIDSVAQCFPLLRPLKRWWILQRLPPLRRPDLPPLSFAELTRQLPNFRRYQQCLEAKRLLNAEVSKLLGEAIWQAWPALRTSLEASLNTLSALVSAVGLLFPDDAELRQRALQALREHLQQGGDAAAATACHRSWRDFVLAVDDANSTLQLDLTEPTAEILCARLDALKRALGSLRNGLRLREAVHAAEACGLADFAAALLAGALTPEALVPTLEQAYATKMFEEVLAQEPTLAHFSGATREQTIAHFAQLDRAFLDLAARKIVATLSSKLPNALTAFGQGKLSPLAILKHECEKQRCHLPVRLLLAKIGDLAHVLKPCFLMSPLSVAQYLPAQTEQFDLLLFDEASQIPVWDAIGTIARCRQVIVVGDPKQMPPTNFFRKENPETEEPEEEIEDLESILDECLASGLFATHLAWHYRSRHESLIAFSNHHYYNDRLLTFPAAANAPTLGIHFHFVKGGVYDRTRTRTNRPEALALVDTLFDLLRHAPTPRRSIGIVTFNEPQKALIEELVDQRRAQEPDLEDFFQEECDAPFFVKNLENVQGDERDLILFSVGYAPDATGKFLMNFGPLNRQGGERRLNVAITRAKEQILLFSSIHATQIDLSRTAALGVTHLRDFIDYAEHLSALSPGELPPPEATATPFVATVDAFLQAHGYQTVRDFGRSERKIDLAIRDPRAPKNFLAAIECDGPAYAQQTVTRDRESLRPAILEGLGWHLIRVWSLDWAFDRPRAEQRLLDAIQASLAPTINPGQAQD